MKVGWILLFGVLVVTELKVVWGKGILCELVPGRAHTAS